MKNPPSTLAEILTKLEKLESNYQEWIKPVNDKSMEIWRKAGVSLKQIEKEISDVNNAQLEKYDPYPTIYAEIALLCDIYLNASEKNREHIRRVMLELKGIHHHLIGFSSIQAKKIEEEKSVEAFITGLAALSIEDCGEDYRDTLLALAELYFQAEQAGLDARKYFHRMSLISSTHTSPGSDASMREILSQFNHYGILQERRSRK